MRTCASSLSVAQTGAVYVKLTLRLGSLNADVRVFLQVVKGGDPMEVWQLAKKYAGEHMGCI